jgi:non-ribosomal peptide synthetase component F
MEHLDAVASHHVVRSEVLDAYVTEAKEASPSELLRELRDAGLLWSVVAEMVGVTDAAVRKWRRGESIDAVHRERLARTAALARLYTAYSMPSAEPSAFAEWLDTRIVPNFSATPLQLLLLNRDADSRELQPLFDWAFDHTDLARGEGVLDHYLSDAWRNEALAEQRFRIVTNSAGERELLIDG